MSATFDLGDAGEPRTYWPAPIRPVRKLASQVEHDIRAARARERAIEKCNAYGGHPHRIRRFTEYPEYFDFFSDALEEVDAEMIAESRSIPA